MSTAGFEGFNPFAISRCPGLYRISQMDVDPDRVSTLNNSEPIKVFIVAGEHSGDLLGGKLMEALKQLHDRKIQFAGVGGVAMEAQGLNSLFPLSDIAVMGVVEIAKRLPVIIRRVYKTVGAAHLFVPDIVVIIDSPEFTHPIARRIRKHAPHIPILNYAPPTVWAWRPGRAAKMRSYIDHVMNLLPFESAAFKRLGGPPGTYVGHPIVEKLDWIDGLQTQALATRLDISSDDSVLVVLPGSRTNEVRHIIDSFTETIIILHDRLDNLKIIVPVMDNVAHLVREGARSWPCPVHYVEGEEDKYAAFKLAKAAMAVSGTVTLELSLTRTPMIVAYRADKIMVPILRRLITANCIAMANLILEDIVFPEFIQEKVVPENMAATLMPLFGDSNERKVQLAALDRVVDKMTSAGLIPSVQAAHVVSSFLSDNNP